MNKIALVIGFILFFFGLDELASDLTATTGWVLTSLGLLIILVALAISKAKYSGGLFSSDDSGSGDCGGD